MPGKNLQPRQTSDRITEGLQQGDYSAQRLNIIVIKR